jgi:hypothetical protein
VVLPSAENSLAAVANNPEPSFIFTQQKNHTRVL